MKGTSKSPPAVSLSEIAWSWIGAFLGIAAVSYINYNMIEETDMIMIIGSFGASAVLIYGAITAGLRPLLVARLGVKEFETQSALKRGPIDGEKL